MLVGLRAVGFAAAAMEIVSDSQAAAFGLYEIIDAVSNVYIVTVRVLCSVTAAVIDLFYSLCVYCAEEQVETSECIAPVVN